MKWLVCLLFLINLAHARVDVKNVTLENKGSNGILTVEIDGKLDQDPELLLKDSIVQIEIPKGVVWPKIEKKATTRNSFDTTLLGYQFDKDLARVRAILPYKIEGQEDRVSMRVDKNQIQITFPLATNKVKKKVATKPAYDEKLLDELLKDKRVESKESASNSFLPTEDQVRTVLSGSKEWTEKDSDKGFFNFGAYAAKFLIFLLVVLGVFFGLANIFKKKVLKKGKLGFLNKTNVLEVLNTSYIAPKKNLMLVRAHNQVFLIGTSEKGIHFLSELTDLNGLLKQGEQQVGGFNFDNKLGDAFINEKEFNLKQEINTPAAEAAPKKSTFSDQIKNKLKELKPLN